VEGARKIISRQHAWREKNRDMGVSWVSDSAADSISLPGNSLSSAQDRFGH
jgi:hypothetical protein